MPLLLSCFNHKQRLQHMTGPVTPESAKMAVSKQHNHCHYRLTAELGSLE